MGAIHSMPAIIKQHLKDPEGLKQLTRRYYDYLVGVIDAQMYLNLLYQEEHLTREDCQTIKNIATNGDKVEELLDMLPLRGPDALMCLWQNIHKKQEFITQEIAYREKTILHGAKDVTGGTNAKEKQLAEELKKHKENDCTSVGESLQEKSDGNDRTSDFESLKEKKKLEEELKMHQGNDRTSDFESLKVKIEGNDRTSDFESLKVKIDKLEEELKTHQGNDRTSDFESLKVKIDKLEEELKTHKAPPVKDGSSDTFKEHLVQTIKTICNDIETRHTFEFADEMNRNGAVKTCLMVLSQKYVTNDDVTICRAWKALTLLCESHKACQDSVRSGGVLSAKYFLKNYTRNTPIMKSALEYLIQVCRYSDLQGKVEKKNRLRIISDLVDSEQTVISFRACMVLSVFEGPRGDTHMKCKIKDAVKRWNRAKSIDVDYDPSKNLAMINDWLQRYQHGKFVFAVWTIHHYMMTNAGKYSRTIRRMCEQTIDRLLKGTFGIPPAEKKKLEKIQDKWNTK